MASTEDIVRKAPLSEMLASVLYLGVVGYGGPAVLAQMKKTFTQQHDWFTETEFMQALSLAQVLPGATGVSVMGYLGYRKYRFWGAILFPLAYIAPALTAVIAISWAYFNYGGLSFVKPLFVGLGALVVALLLNATLNLGKSVFKGKRSDLYKGAIISVLTFVGTYMLKLNIIWLIIAAGLLGAAFFYSRGEPQSLEAAETAQGAHPSKSRFRITAAHLPLFILAAAIAAIMVFATTRLLFVTFFQIGLFAFGGGFTAVPLIQHIVVDQFHWMSFTQFRDGIAVGQITPGPVFITATFIGYKVSGVVGALVATFGVFLPSTTLMVSLVGVHEKVKHLKIVQVVIRGFLFGFIGMLVSVTLQFALKSLAGWQTWVVFGGVFFYVWYLKKNAIWAILATIAFSLLVIGR